MSIATTVGDALAFEEIDFDLLRHETAFSAAQAAEKAGIDADKLAKAVLLKDPHGYLLAVLPATRHLDLSVLQTELHRHLELASEQDLDDWFCDCAIGSVPPIGPWYRLPTVGDAKLRAHTDIYFEAGGRRALIHVSETGFEQLMSGAEYLRFSPP